MTALGGLAERLGSGGCRSLASSSRDAPLVARPGLGQRSGRVPLRHLELDRPRVRPERRLDALPRALVAADDRAGAAAGAPAELVHVFSAFGVGLLANAIVPGRLGELARVATLRRHLPDAPPGTSATLVGTVFAHRLFDLVPATLLVVWVLLTAEVPHWAVVSLMIAAAVGFALFTIAWMGARRHDRPVVSEGLGSIRQLLSMARQGLSVLKAPLPLAGAVLLQCLGWLMQLLAVYAAMQAFGIDAPLPAAGLVLVLMNIATIVPLWPGNVGLVQAAVALPLRNYGVPYATGFAYGLALQAIEMACGVGLGLLALAREGISVAMLRRMEDDERSSEDALDEVHELVEELEEGPHSEAAREGAPVPR